MPVLDLGTPSEIWGRDRAELQRNQPAEPGVSPVRRGRRQVVGDGVCEIGGIVSAMFDENKKEQSAPFI